MVLLLLPGARLLLLGVVWVGPSAVTCGGAGGAGHTGDCSRGHDGTSRDTETPASARSAQAALGEHRRHSGSWFWAESSLVSKRKLVRDRRSSLTRLPLGPSLPQEQPRPGPSAFGVRFHKCAQVKVDSDPPEISFFLLIHNMASAALGSNLSQVAIRDCISGIVPFRSAGREVERGYQSFSLDALYAGAQVVLNYSAHVRSPTSGILELPAFLTFSNTSQNDVSMFGPLTANLTLRVNATNRIALNHAVHFAGFVGGFLVSLLLVLSGFMVMNWTDPSLPLRLCHRRRRGAGPGPEFTDCDLRDRVRDEAALQDKMIDLMILEEPHNMPQALDSLEMASLLHASTLLEAARLQIHKALVGALLGGAEGRLLEVVQGQVMGAEGRLKEQLKAKMAALAIQCNRETRDAMETQHLRHREEKEWVECLCQGADQPTVLHCSLLLEKLHNRSARWLQRLLLVRHEEASARVQREVTEQRRVELHKIFCEELEEATRLGELDLRAAASLQHQYFTCQDLVEDVLDEVVAHQRFVLSERQAQRSFLLQSLQSLHSLLSETFSTSSKALDHWLSHARRLGRVPEEQLQSLCDGAQQQVALLRQRLEEALTEEKRGLRCGLLKRRRELLSDLLQVHRQQQEALSPLSLEEAGLLETLYSWRSLLSSQSSEFSELVKRLDEEAAADIRKVMTRLLKGTVAELRTLHLSLAQSLQAAFSPGERPLLQTEEAALPQDQALSDRLQQDGQSALLTLNTTRERLQGALQSELSEQREARDRSRAFFRRLCSCQLSLSEADLLQMKLEFHKCLCVMDRCLVLPPAVHRTKLHCTLEQWRSDQEQLVTRAAAKGKSSSSKSKPGSELQRLQRSLQERAALFERLEEQEAGLREEVLQQIHRDSQASLLSRACVISAQLVSGQLEKVQCRSRALQMWTALMSLQSLLIQELPPTRDKMKDSVQMHWEGLAAAEEEFHKDLSSLLDSSHTTDPILSVSEEGVFQLQPDCRMVSILQGALHKREELLSVLAQSCEQWTSRTQVMEELKEQLELRRLQQLCLQELQFVSDLVKLAEVPPNVLKEMLRLLLPSLPESELLSLTEGLSLKHSSADPQSPLPPGWSSVNSHVIVKLRDNVVCKAAVDAPASTEQTERMDERRWGLLQKLLPSACVLPPTAAPGVQTRSKPDSGDPQPGPSQTIRPGSHDPGPEHGPGEYMSLSPSPGCHGDRDDPRVRLFIFRDPPPSIQTPGGATRKRKRNFLNFKKNAVLPTTLT